MHNYRKLRIYDVALALATEVYALSRRLPENEEFGLRSQWRRAAVSTCLNIAEGSGASSNREFGRFLEIARRSLYEVVACVQLSVRLDLLDRRSCEDVSRRADSLAAMITRFKGQLRG